MNSLQSEKPRSSKLIILAAITTALLITAAFSVGKEIYWGMMCHLNLTPSNFLTALLHCILKTFVYGPALALMAFCVGIFTFNPGGFVVGVILAFLVLVVFVILGFFWWLTRLPFKAQWIKFILWTLFFTALFMTSIYSSARFFCEMKYL